MPGVPSLKCGRSHSHEGRSLAYLILKHGVGQVEMCRVGFSNGIEYDEVCFKDSVDGRTYNVRVNANSLSHG
jgi:hypothetical protein